MEPIEIGVLKKQREGFTAFIPNTFPPGVGFPFDPPILKKNDEARGLVGKLDGITQLLPDVDYFLMMYLRKDAAASSQIEGTKATMVDAIEAEAQSNTKIPSDVDDILHYINALEYGMQRVGEDEFPIALRFIRELHEQLTHHARATQYAAPGQFRDRQNWIGGSKPENAGYVPPPLDDMHRALGDLEKFINTADDIPTVIKAGLIHAQFETIHPFIDGNGRTGRMLINFFLWRERALEKPVLFLSSFFKKNQQLYYDKLSAYHNGKVGEWLDFFLDGVIEIAGEAIGTVRDITTLREKDLERINSLGKRSAESAMKVLPHLYAQPVVNVAMIQKWTGFSRPGAQSLIDRFIEKGILSPKDKDVTYGQSYVYRDYLRIFTGGD